MHTYGAILDRSLEGKRHSKAGGAIFIVSGAIISFKYTIDNGVGLDTKHGRAPHVNDGTNSNTNEWRWVAAILFGAVTSGRRQKIKDEIRMGGENTGQENFKRSNTGSRLTMYA